MAGRRRTGPGWVRVAKGALAVGAAVVVVAILAVGAALGLATTSWGSERLLRLALPRLNRTLAGELACARLRFGGDRIVLEGLALRDPEGAPVARVERVAIVFRPLALLRRRIDVRSIDIESPALVLVRNAEGETNLGRALASRDGAAARTAAAGPAPPPGASHGSGPEVALGALTVHDGSLEYRDASGGDDDTEEGGPLRHVQLDGLRVNASGHAAGVGRGAFALHLDATAEAQSPLHEAVTVRLDGAGTSTGAEPRAGAGPDTDAALHLELAIGDSAVVLSTHLRFDGGVAGARTGTSTGAGQGAPSRATLDLERVHLTPALIHALAPQAQALVAAVTASGSASWDGDAERASAHLALLAAGAHVSLTATADTRRRILEGLTVRAEAIDLGRLLAGAPRSTLGLALDAHGSGSTLATLRGALTLDVSRGTLGGHAIGPVRLRLDADRGRYKVLDLDAALPGGHLRAGGDATATTLDLHARVDLRDLGITADSFLPPPRPIARALRTSRQRSRATRRPDAAGSGRVDLAIGGTPQAPSLRLTGHLDGLRWQELEASRLSLALATRDLRAPVRTNVSLEVPELRLGARRLHGLRVEARFDDGPRATARVTLGGATPVALVLGGHWEGRARAGAHPDAAAMVLDAMTLTFPGVTWDLQGPARLAVAGDAVGVEHLALATPAGPNGAAAQRLTLDLRKAGRRLDADATLVAIDLASLPGGLLPAPGRLGGRVDGHLEVHLRPHGKAERPLGSAQLSLTGGRIGDVRDLGLDANLQVRAAGKGMDLSGTLGASGWGARLAGRFDVPVPDGFPKALLTSPAPLDVALDVSDLDLARVMAGLEALGGPAAARADRGTGTPAALAVGGGPPRGTLRGQGTAHVRILGTGASPSLSVEAQVRQLVTDGLALGDVQVQLDAPADRPLTIRLDLPPPPTPAAKPATSLPAHAAGPPSHPPAAVEASAAPPSSVGPGAKPPVPGEAPARSGGAPRAHVLVRTAFTLTHLLHHPPTTASVLDSPVHVEAEVEGLPLEPVGRFLQPPRVLGGRAGLRLTLDGPPRAARAQLALTVAGAEVGRFPATDAALDVDLGAAGVRARARLSRRGSTLVTVDAHIATSMARLLQGRGAATGLERLASMPLELHARVGPLELRRAGLQPETDRDPPRLLAGRLEASVDVVGTLRAPQVVVVADLGDLRMDDTALGSGRGVLRYKDRRASADLQLTSARAGHLHLSATAEADLGAAIVAAGGPSGALDPRRVPLTARLDADGFDISGLSGATPGLRAVSGRFFASVAVTGTVADPRPTGQLEWKDGGLTITGLGAYKAVHLKVHGALDHVVLDELRADSGDGHARLTGSGSHAPAGGYSVDLRTDLARFPVYVEGQALAAVSLQAATHGSVSVRAVRVKVTIDSARVALSDAKRKHLQPLAPAADIVRVDGDQPLNATQAARLAAIDRRIAAGAPATLAAGQAAPSPAQRQRAEKAAGVVVTVEAPRNLWVDGDDAKLELGLEPGFRVEITDAVRAFGQVTIKRGRVDVVGRRFDLKAGSEVQLSGPVDEPELDVEAHHLNETENITVVVTVKGTPGHLKITIRAPDRPDLTETQLYTLVVTGRLDLGGGTASATTPTDRAVSLVGGLVAAQLQKALSSKLPFDVLTIEEGNGVGDARIEAGTYLTSDLYVGYVGRTGADPALLQNRNAVHLEYELTTRWSFQGEYGDAKTGSADLMWTRRY
jgi:translocation and assembly module TamB